MKKTSYETRWATCTRILLRTLLLLIAFSFPSRCTAAPPAGPALARAVQAAIAKVKPALIRIRVVEADYMNGRENKMESFGSGVIISPDGYAVTNHHVAGNAKRLKVTLSTKKEVEARLVGTDALSDIAVIRLESVAGKKYPAAGFGDSSAVRVGDQVLAMGSPVALSQSVTTGIVSNTEMIMPQAFWPSNALELDGEDVGSMVRWIGHDARIAGGNSGGPLVNMRGEIIGINEIQLGLSGAIPAAIVKNVSAQILSRGRVTRSWLGLEVQPLLKSLPVRAGALVADVALGSPASKAGLKPGDIVQSVAGKRVSVLYGEDVPLFNQMIAALPVGKPVRLAYTRGGVVASAVAVTQAREEALPRQREFDGWGMTGRDLSAEMARTLSRASRSGVLVTSVSQSGPAADAKPPVEEDDVIVSVGGATVKSSAALAAETARLLAGKSGRVPTLVAFDRGQERYLTVVRLGRDPLRDPGVEASKAWVPVGVQVLTQEVATALGMPGQTGVRVTEVYPSHSAAGAGVKVGDIITMLDGEAIEASHPQDYEVFPAMVRQKTIGQEAQLTILRDSSTLTVAVKLEPSPKLPREMKRYRSEDFEFTVRNQTFSDADRSPVAASVKGVVVEAVDEGGWAALARLAVGDIIMAVAGRQVADVAEVEAIMVGITSDKPRHVVLHVKRDAKELFVEMEPGWRSQ